MLWATYNGTPVSVQAGGILPLNTIVCNTNNNATLSSNAINISKTGWYTASINAVLSSTEAVTTTVQLCQQNVAVNNASMTVDIPANGTATIAMEWPVKVIHANSGTATVSWTLSTAATVDDVIANVKAIT